MQHADFVDTHQVRQSLHSKAFHQTETWGDIRADLVKRMGLGRQETFIANSRHTFLMNLSGSAREGEDFIDGRRVPFTKRQPGSIVYIPADREWRGWDTGDEIGVYLLVSIEPDHARRMLGATGGPFLSTVPPTIGFRDNTVEFALRGIVQELRHPDLISTTMVESQAMQMFVGILRRYGRPDTFAKGGLSPFELRRATKLLEALLDERPSLVRLSSEFNLSPRHFARAFKQSTGMTPHTFLAKCRLTRAADKLRSTNESATAIAHACGFGSSSNFSIAFKRAYGLSPSAYRKGWRT